MIRTNQKLLKFVSGLAQLDTSGFIVEKRYNSGQRILKQDEKAFSVYLIRRGIAKCLITEKNDKDYILEFLGEGEIIGELEVINDSCNLGSIEALTEVDVYKIAHPFFKELLIKHPDFNQLVLKELATRLTNTASRVSNQQSYSTEHSILKLTHLLQQQNISISKNDLADYLGVTLRSINRNLFDLQQKGLLDQSLFIRKKT